jgi:hypothetical protein
MGREKAGKKLQLFFYLEKICTFEKWTPRDKKQVR